MMATELTQFDENLKLKFTCIIDISVLQFNIFLQCVPVFFVFLQNEDATFKKNTKII